MRCILERLDVYVTSSEIAQEVITNLLTTLFSIQRVNTCQYFSGLRFTNKTDTSFYLGG